MAQTRIAELASIISTQTTIFDDETPQIPKEISASKNIIIEATEELNSLIAGPVRALSSIDITILPTLHATYRWKLASSFPLDGEASCSKIADTVGIPEADIRRIIRMAKTHQIFREPRDWDYEIWPAFTRMVDAIESWPDSQEPNETGYNLATNQFDTYFEGMKESTHREKRFADVMTFLYAGDLPDVVEGIETPEDVKGRVEIVAHDFFTEQPVKGADAINGGSDFTMKSYLNGRERDADEWAQLFEKADSRFRFQGIAAVPSSRFSVIEAIWEDGSAPGLRRT
ncbi:hypothetical protein BHYA_0046g00300 [Botrytis hyacinthi]|uniref:O-methyltransferase domain-containing protein n=1 Tax=Botrytis hyacinthi TaxID=278943 RepID=A0A4Z1GSL0_9HELO|nr:hypothetical protein BHYA_0046g00300 [Botrytis hyacinthi]